MLVMNDFAIINRTVAPIMSDFTDISAKSIAHELDTLWAAHHAVGLKGKMLLYTLDTQEPLRSHESGLKIFFGPKDTTIMVEEVRKYYKNGKLPNTPLLLNPIVHDDYETPIGSGIVWATGLAVGVEKMAATQADRIKDLHAFSSYFERGEVTQAGLKMVGFAREILKPQEDGTIPGCKQLYDVSDFKNPEYSGLYLLSGISYLGKHGGFVHPDFTTIIPKDMDVKTAPKMDVATLKDAAFCWDSYDRHPSLFERFGVDTAHVEHNLKFYNLCARDIGLFEATGAKHASADTSATFEFIVKGWIPRGAVTVIGASGGTGKSSLAHNLAVKAAIDYREDEPRPTWLGSEVDIDNLKGLCIYFSGEDGPAIVHSRAKVYDPEGRAKRSMFFRTDFGEGGTLGTFLKRLMKLPDASLVVIDPARKYLTGDENDASVVSEFFEAIEEFAIRKNCGMVVVHHLAKGARPKQVLEIYDLLRGSQVFIDRPRVVVGMYREGKYTIAGLAKNNIPPQLGMIQGERLYTRNAEKLELVLVPGPAGIRDVNAVVDDE
jgi:AAA domain